jgi:hypothetical protein
VLVIHDTTQFEFPGNSKREGLGRLIHPGQGFFGHFALVATADGARVPLGLAANAVVAEKAVRRLQLSVIQSLWKALSGPLAETIREQPESSIQPNIAQIRVAELR